MKSAHNTGMAPTSLSSEHRTRAPAALLMAAGLALNLAVGAMPIAARSPATAPAQSPAPPIAPETPPEAVTPETREQVMQALGSRTLMFVENLGQFRAQDLDGDGQPDAGAAPRFLLSGATGGNTWLAEDGIWITLATAPALDDDPIRNPQFPIPNPKSRIQSPQSKIQNPQSRIQNVKLSFPGRNPQARIEARGRLEVSFNYFLGNDETKWVANAPVYAAARYVELYPGVDLEVRAEGGGWQGVFVEKRPGALRAAQPALRVEGADGVRLDVANGQIVVATMLGERSLPLFRAETATGRALAAGELPATQVRGDTILAPLTLEQPVTHAPAGVNAAHAAQYSGLAYSTFLGGSGNDYGYDIALDSSGNAYVTGYTNSTSFPTTAGAYDTTHNGNNDVFVTKLNAAGSALLYSAFLGGYNGDMGYGIAVDGSGNAYVIGHTESHDFPTTAGAYATTHGGVWDVFVAKLNATGSALLYSTFLGGHGYEAGYDIAPDANGNACVTGGTASINFPTTAGAHNETYNGGWDAFVTKLNATGSALLYSTFLGGSDYEWGNSLALDGSGNVYVTGGTTSTSFPTTVGAHDTTHNGNQDAFVAQLNASGSALVYSTFLGGSGNDYGHAIALDSGGNAVVTGNTQSAGFPVTTGAHDTTYNGSGDAFVAKLNAGGSALLYSTFLGGDDSDSSFGVAVDGDGNAYVTGYAHSTGFPVTAGAYDATHNGDRDAFVAQLSADGSALLYSTFLGGSSYDHGNSMALDGSGNVFVTGNTQSSDYPTTAGAYDTMHNGGFFDVFVTRLFAGPPPAAFGKTTPADGATGQPASPTLSWTAPTTGTVNHYRYCYATTTGCAPGTSNGTATSAALSGLTPGATYYWQARACADAGCTVFTDADGGAHWSFTVLDAPGAFSKSAPADGATGQPNNPTLSWGAAGGTVNHYRYCYATTTGCVPVTSNGTATSAALSGLTPGATYYWQARACADAGCTVFTDADGGAHWSFTVLDDGVSNLNNADTRKEATPTAVRMGEAVTYTIVLSNSGAVAVTARVTDTLAVSATLLSAMPGYAQTGQTLVWSNVAVPANGTATLTITVRAGSGPLPGGYTLNNSALIGAHDGEITRAAPAVQVRPWEAFLPIVLTP